MEKSSCDSPVQTRQWYLGWYFESFHGEVFLTKPNLPAKQEVGFKKWTVFKCFSLLLRFLKYSLNMLYLIDGDIWILIGGWRLTREWRVVAAFWDAFSCITGLAFLQTHLLVLGRCVISMYHYCLCLNKNLEKLPCYSVMGWWRWHQPRSVGFCLGPGLIESDWVVA